MATLAELAKLHHVLEPDQLSHLQRLLGSWALLSDLSFSDLVLLVPVPDLAEGAEGPQMIVLGQIRPNNRPTRLYQDLVGQSVSQADWSIAAAAIRQGEIVQIGRAHG